MQELTTEDIFHLLVAIELEELGKAEKQFKEF